MAHAPTATPPPAPPAPPPDASYRLRYVASPAPVLEISVTTASAEAGLTTFDLGTGFANVTDPEASVRDVSATDDRGQPLTISHPTPHTWRVHGALGHPVTLRYTVFSTQPPGFDNRFRPIINAHLVHFVGSLVLMQPTDLADGACSMRFTWDGLEAAHLQPATSFGSKQTEDVHDTFDHILESVFVASDAMRRITRPAGEGTLELAVTGSWGFTDAELADYIVRVMTMERAFFADRGPPYFFVNVFPLDGGTRSYSGTGYTHSFDLALTAGFTLDAHLRGAIAHEHFHTWNGLLVSPEAFETLTYWVTEGFTNFYTARLRYRAGLSSLADYTQEINEDLATYLRSPARGAPNARSTGFWDEPSLGKLPYVRGHVVALLADREIRRATGGKLSLDDVMRVLVKTGRKGATITSERVLAMIEGLTSSGFAARLRATVIDGAALAIDPALLEPCLTATSEKMWTYELGFDWPATRAIRKIVGVRPGSAAARAGLHDGDSLGGFSLHLGDPTEQVVLTIGPTRRTISYLPRGQQVTVPQFAIHDAGACAAVLGPPLP